MAAIDVLNDAQSGVGYVGSLVRKGNVVWAVGGAWGSPLLMTSDGGKTFRRRKPPEANGLRDVLPLGQTHALVVGEGGALFETKDAETWRAIETGTSGCLFAIERAEGSIWISGDDGFVLTSADGSAWRKPKLGKRVAELGRIQRLRHVFGSLWLLGYDGKLGFLKNDQVVLAPLASDTPLTAIAFSPRGIGVVVGDGGKVFRSTNKGKTWNEVDTHLDVDLEDVTFSEGRFVVVGADGVLLVSDDGESFRRVDTGRDEHLWCVVADGKGVLVGGDGGLILRASEEALAASVELTADGEDEDEKDEEEEPAEIPDAMRLADSAIDAAELEKASARWIAEGRKYYEDLNAFVAQFYVEDAPKLEDEPVETRKDMATFVQRAAVQLNREKRTGDLRRMFPPSYEAFDYEDIGQSIHPALFVDDVILARVGDEVLRIDGDAIERLDGVVAFGRSRDRKNVALAFRDRIEIRGRLQGLAHANVTLPKAFGEIDTLSVFPDGERVLVAGPRGVLVVSARGTEKLHGGDGEMSYVHAAHSPDGRTIACGDQDGPHRIFGADSGGFVLAAEIEPASSYPNFAMFHDDGIHLVLSSCHFSESATLGVEIGSLKAKPDAKKTRKPLKLAADDARLTLIDDRRWMYCGISRPKGYLLGDRNGYAWYLGFDGAMLAYLHVGSTMESMDVDAGDTALLFGTCAGILSLFDRTSKESEDYKVRSMKTGRESRRWVFWKGFPPLVW